MSVEAPERIWVSPNDAYELPWEHASASPDDFNEDGVEYVRADKLEELAAVRDEVREECAEVGKAAVMKFRHKVGGRYYPGYHEDMREFVAAAIRASKGAGE